MTARHSLGAWLWKVPACGAVHAMGLLAGLTLAGALGLSMPGPIDGANPTVQAWLLLPAGMAIAAGMAAMAIGLPGGWGARTTVLATFMWIVHGVANGLESSIFTTLGGSAAMTVAQLPASLLCAMAVSWLFAAPESTLPSATLRDYVARWTASALTLRLAAAFVAFPVIYFLFGVLISPIVIPYYERLDFLTIPSMPTLFGVLVTRSALLLLASLPIVVLWRGSFAQLVIGLGLAHFVAVGLAGLIQGTFLPAILRWTHGVEILADSMSYAWALAWLLSRRETPAIRSPLEAHGRVVEPMAIRKGAIMSTNSRRFAALSARIAVLTFVLVVIQGFASQFMPAAQEGAGASAQPSGSFLAIVLIVAFLQTVALAYPIIRSRWHGWLLVGTAFVLYFGTVTVTSQIESVVYLGGHLPPGMLRGIVLMGLVNALLFAPILVLVLGKTWAGRDGPGEVTPRLHLSRTDWAKKLVAGGVAFTALYYLFGYYVAWKNPAVREYYGGTDPGSFLAQMADIVRGMPWMLPLQFMRGLLWILLALPVIAMMKGRWWEAGLALSVLFAVPVTYLLFPNPVMPETVRMSHLVETFPYQFLFGWFVAWLFAAGPRHVPLVPHLHAKGA